MFIYRFTNPKNKRIYIGKWNGSIRSLFKRYITENRKRPIINVIKKHGLENIKFEIIKENIQSKEELNSLEIHFIKFYNSTKNVHGYNCTPGGDGGDTCSNHPMRNEIIEKRRKSQIGKKRINKTNMYGHEPWNKGKKLNYNPRANVDQSGSKNPQWKEFSQEIINKATELYKYGASIRNINRQCGIPRHRLKAILA